MENDVSKRIILLVVAFGSFLITFTASSVNIAIPSIGLEFLMDAVLLSWITTSYLLASTMLLIPFGRVADILGRRRIFNYGIIIFTVSSFFSAVSTTPTLLILSRILQGIGAAMVFSTGIAILTSAFPVGERGKALGITIASVYLGLSLGPFLGGVLTQNLGWRSLFILNAVLGLVTIAFTIWKLKGEWAEAKGESFDFIGSIIYSFSLVTAIYGFSQLPSKIGLWLILAGSVGILVFVKWESKVENPILNLSVFKRNRVFILSNLAILIIYSSTFAVSFLLNLYLQYIKGINAQIAGLILLIQPAIQTVFSPLAGKLSDRTDPGMVASIGIASMSIGLFLFTFLNEWATLEFILAGLILLGFGFAFFSSPNTNAIMSSINKKFYGVASATLGTMRLTGQTLSMSIVMFLINFYIGKAQITPEHFPLLLESMRKTFILFTSLCLGGIIASLMRRKNR